MTTLLFLVLLASASLSRELYVGSRCPKNKGVCTLVINCPEALASLQEHHYHNYQRCGFEGNTEVVCCPSSTRSHHHHSTTEDPDESSSMTPEIRAPQASKNQKACAKYWRDAPRTIFLSYHIVGGREVEPGELPHNAALGFYNSENKIYKFNCGGSLISERYIVTAAHCIFSRENKLKIARLGCINVPDSVDSLDPESDYTIENVTVHEKYNFVQKLNDIALIKLEKRVRLSNLVRPACLYTKNDDPDDLLVSGWGATQLAGERSEKLLQAKLRAVSFDECKNVLRLANKTVTRSHICATWEGRDSCQGDSGGPLQIKDNDTNIVSLVGVTSYGVGCGSKFPGVYSRISSFVNWIEEIVWP